jgi:alcohol dehydrogenase class IV
MQEYISGPPVGKFTTTHLRRIGYGPDSIAGLWDVIQDIKADSRACPLADDAPKALIMTGNSLSKTPVISQIQSLLQEHNAYAGLFHGMKQHAPISGIEDALKACKDNGCNIIVAVGGGSVIDAAKLVSHFHNERYGSFVPHVSVVIV